MQTDFDLDLECRNQLVRGVYNRLKRESARGAPLIVLPFARFSGLTIWVNKDYYYTRVTVEPFIEAFTVTKLQARPDGVLSFVVTYEDDFGPRYLDAALIDFRRTCKEWIEMEGVWFTNFLG